MKDYEKLTKEHFDGMAERYAATDGTYFSPLPKACCDAASEVLEEAGFSRLLDVGCGSGYLLHKLAKSHKTEFFGLDLSPKMLFEAKKRLSAFDNVRLSEGSSARLPYRDGEFDAVTCIMSLHHYPEPRKAVSEAFRVLACGGVYILADVDGERGYELGEEEVKAYTLREAEALLAEGGFRVEQARTEPAGAIFLVARKHARCAVADA